MSDLPKGWKIVSLGDIGMSQGSGVNPLKNPNTVFQLWSVPSFPTGSPVYLSGSEIKSGKQGVEKGDVLLCKINPRINRVWVVGDNEGYQQIASTEWITFKCSLIDSYFLAWQFRESKFRELLCSNLSGVGGSLTRARPQDVKKYTVSIAPLNEQRRIVAKLESCEARISVAREAMDDLPKLLQQYRQSVLAAAFRGDLTRDWRAAHPDVEPAESLLARLRIERRQRWEQNELTKYEQKDKDPPKNWQHRYKEPIALSKASLKSLPCLPKGWIWTTVDNICSQITDGEHIQPKYKSIGLPMLTAKHVRDGFVTQDGAGLISPDDFDRCLARCKPELGDVLIVSVGATTGRSAIVQNLPPFALVRSVLLLKPIGDGRFIHWWTKTKHCIDWMTSASGATAQAHLYINDTRGMPIPLAPQSEQAQLSEILDELLNRISKISVLYRETDGELVNLTQSLLAKTFRGELVPQNPSDEPASVLLARLKEERAKNEDSKKTPTKKKRLAKVTKAKITNE